MDNIHSFLFDLGIPVSMKGFDYLHDAIKMVMDDNSWKGKTCELYKEIGKSYNVTHTRVERCMRTSIEACFKAENLDNLSSIFGDKNTSKGSIKNSEFIAISALYLK